MNTYRDAALARLPDVAWDEDSPLADAISELLYAFDMQLPMADQLRAITRYEELIND